MTLISTLVFPPKYRSKATLRVQSYFRPAAEIVPELISSMGTDKFYNEALISEAKDPFNYFRWLFRGKIDLRQKDERFIEIACTSLHPSVSLSTLEALIYYGISRKYSQSKTKVLAAINSAEIRVKIIHKLLDSASKNIIAEKEKTTLAKLAREERLNWYKEKIINIAGAEKKLSSLKLNLTELQSRYGQKHPEITIKIEHITRLSSYIENLRRSQFQPNLPKKLPELGPLENASMDEALKKSTLVQHLKQLYSDLFRYKAEIKLGAFKLELVQNPKKGRLLNRLYFNSIFQDRGFVVLLLTFIFFSLSLLWDQVRDWIIFSGLIKNRQQKMNEILGAPQLVDFKAYEEDLAKVGNIIWESKGKQIDDSDANIRRPFLLLRTLVQFRASQISARTINLTAPIEMANYSELCISIIAYFVKLNIKILIVDLNFQNPTLHKVFDLDNTYGVSNLLKNPEKFLPLPVAGADANVKIIPVGPKIDNHDEFLNSKNFIRFMDRLKKEADYVFILSPPLNDSSESIIIATICDTTILVLNENSSNVSVLETAKFHLDNCKVPLLGYIYF
ncbi:hypothetical protein ACFL35_02875 [Candidatus Riflebacteria bacterium]